MGCVACDMIVRLGCDGPAERRCDPARYGRRPRRAAATVGGGAGGGPWGSGAGRVGAGLSWTAFARRFHMPFVRLLDWERGRWRLEATALAYLRVIYRALEGITRSLGEARSGEEVGADASLGRTIPRFANIVPKHDSVGGAAKAQAAAAQPDGGSGQRSHNRIALPPCRQDGINWTHDKVD